MNDFQQDRLRRPVVRFLERTVPVLDEFPGDGVSRGSTAAAWERVQALEEYKALVVLLENDSDVCRDLNGHPAFADSFSVVSPGELPRSLLDVMLGRRHYDPASSTDQIVDDLLTYLRRRDLDVLAVSPTYGLQVPDETVRLNDHLFFGVMPPEVLQQLPLSFGGLPLGLEHHKTALMMKITESKARLYDERKRGELRDGFHAQIFGARRLVTCLSRLCWEEGLCSWWTYVMAYPINPTHSVAIQVDTIPDAAMLARPHMLVGANVDRLRALLEAAAGLKTIEQRRVGSALEWANRGFSVDDQFAAIVHYFTALEALFLKDEEKSEMSERLAIRAATFLGKSAEGRVRVYDTIKEGYELRSLAVHRGRWDQSRKFKRRFPMATVLEIRKITKSALEGYLRSDVADRFLLHEAEYWKKALFGAQGYQQGGRQEREGQ